MTYKTHFINLNKKLKNNIKYTIKPDTYKHIRTVDIVGKLMNDDQLYKAKNLPSSFQMPKESCFSLWNMCGFAKSSHKVSLWRPNTLKQYEFQ